MTISNLIRRTAAIGVAVIAISAAVTVGQAQASVTRHAPVKHSLEKRGMNIVGFDLSVAKAHGYKIVTYPNGDQQAVPINPRSHLPKGPLLKKADRNKAIRPADTTGDTPIYGNCGYSWVAVNKSAPSHINLESGFGLVAPAWYYSWTVQLTDANGTSTQGASGTLASRSSWSGEWNNLFQRDYSFDEVLTGSYAVMLDGSVCYSGGPWIDITGL